MKIRKEALLKIGLTILLFIVLFVKINPSEIIGILFSLHLSYFVIAIFFVPILYLIRTYKWSILLDSIKIKTPFVNLFKVLIIGVFYGLVTPGKVGEIVRAYYLDEKKSVTIPTILMEKIIDIFILVILSILTVILFFTDYSAFWYILIILILSLILAILLLTNKKIILLLSKPFKIEEENIDIYIDIFSKLIKDKGAMSKATILTICYYLTAYILAFFLLLSLDVNTWVVTTLPLIVLMGNIPITISGLGLRESIATICFMLLGEKGAYGFSFSILLFFTITLLPGIFGYFFVISARNNEDSRGQITGLLSPLLEKWRLNKIKKYVTGNKILDFGCGYGKLATILSEKEYVGIDINKTVLEFAKEINAERKNAKFYSLDSFEDKNCMFDTIILAAVVEHMECPVQTLMKLKEHLQGGGRVIITTPTSNANEILRIGSKIKLFSKESLVENNELWNKYDFINISKKIGLKLEYYERFEFGLNQLAVYRNESKL